MDNFDILTSVGEGRMENLDMLRTSQAGSIDHHETINTTDDDVEEKEICGICDEDLNVNQMHTIMPCHHTYCFYCMDLYVEVELADHDGVPKGPIFECNSKFIKDDCKKFWLSKWLDLFIKRLEEAEIPKIPNLEKVYCPYSDYLFFMALSGL